MRRLALLALVCPISYVPTAHAALWKNVTEVALAESTGGWTNKCDVADVNGDGRVDILFANGSAYNKPGQQQLNGVWFNTRNDADGNPIFEDVSGKVLGTDPDFTRVIKGRDVNGDGLVDILAGNTYETQSRLFLGVGGGEFEERTDLLPQIDASVGDLEVGDVDGDGDLDIVLADWGLDSVDGEELQDPFTAPGGRTMLWLNELDGDSGRFVDATADRMPEVAVAWSWELELIDVDADFDLDVMVSCKACAGGFLFRNDDGRFDHDPDGLPQFTNNYDFEPMFVTMPDSGNSTLIVATINDGEQVDPGNQFDLRERLFAADGGRFRDATRALWPDEHNAGADDNMVVVLDFESDGDPDFLIGALGGGEDRLHINMLDDERGAFVLASNVGLSTGLDGTPGTLGVALADLNGDGKLDVVQSQGELADPEHVWLGDEIPADTAAPIIQALDPLAQAGDGLVLRARIHDNKSPSRPHDYDAVALRWAIDGEEQDPVALRWTGEFMWRADIADPPAGTVEYQLCATDIAGNEACSETLTLEGKTDAVDSADDPDQDAAGCGCIAAARPAPAGLALMLLGLVAIARARRP